MVFLLMPFDLTFAVSSIVYILLNCLIAAFLAIALDIFIHHGADPRKIITLSLVSYAIPLIVFSFIWTAVPFGDIITYASPLVVWIAAGQFILPETEITKKIIMAAAGYSIFIILAIIQVQLIITMSIGF